MCTVGEVGVSGPGDSGPVRGGEQRLEAGRAGLAAGCAFGGRGGTAAEGSRGHNLRG